jgi:hypothetical protein
LPVNAKARANFGRAKTVFVSLTTAAESAICPCARAVWIARRAVPSGLSAAETTVFASKT